MMTPTPQIYLLYLPPVADGVVRGDAKQQRSAAILSAARQAKIASPKNRIEATFGGEFFSVSAEHFCEPAMKIDETNPPIIRHFTHRSAAHAAPSNNRPAPALTQSSVCSMK
jgi:hypothetical protein